MTRNAPSGVVDRRGSRLPFSTRAAISARSSAGQFGREDEELLAAPAHDEVAVAHGGTDAPPHFDDDGVAGRVAVPVVDVLEVVDVDHHQRAAEALRAGLAGSQAP